MYRSNCLLCNGVTSSKVASIAPFLIKYLDLKQDKTELRYCEKCDFAFFSNRLTEDEHKRLYSDYRGENYNRVRLAVEPSYRNYLPFFESPLSDYYTARNRDYVELVTVFPEMGNVESILDFGGDGIIPARAFPWAEVEVDDLSHGVNNKENKKYDLIFASNVFEHLADPVFSLRNLTKKMQSEGIIFIDVPPQPESNLRESMIVQEMKGGELFLMHEHISHFSRRSLSKLIFFADLIPLVEYTASNGCLFIVAGLKNSNITKSALSEKMTRELLIETKKTHREVSVLRHTITNSTATSIGLRQELDRVYSSTSWEITAPLRALARLLAYKR